MLAVGFHILITIPSLSSDPQSMNQERWNHSVDPNMGSYSFWPNVTETAPDPVEYANVNVNANYDLTNPAQESSYLQGISKIPSSSTMSSLTASEPLSSTWGTLTTLQSDVTCVTPSDDGIFFGKSGRSTSKIGMKHNLMFDHLRHDNNDSTKQSLTRKHDRRRRVHKNEQVTASRCSKKRHRKRVKHVPIQGDDNRRLTTTTPGPLNLPPAVLYSCLLAARQHGRTAVESKYNGQNFSHSFEGLWKNQSYAVDVNITARPVMQTRKSITAEKYRWYQPSSNRSKKSDGFQYPCTSGCPWSTKRKADWDMHERRHYPPMVWLCPREDCTLRGGKLPAFVRQNELVKHLETCHQEALSSQNIETCCIQIDGSQFPRQCIFRDCAEEFTTLQDRSNHIDREHFSQFDAGPWRTVQQNTAPASGSTVPDENVDVDSSSSGSTKSDLTWTSLTSSSNGEDDDSGPPNGGAGNEHSSHGFFNHGYHTSSPDESHGDNVADSNGTGPVGFNYWSNMFAISYRSRFSQRYTNQGLVLLPFLLGCPWSKIHGILIQTQYHLQQVPGTSKVRGDIPQSEKALIRKILYHHPFDPSTKSNHTSDGDIKPSHYEHNLIEERGHSQSHKSSERKSIPSIVITTDYVTDTKEESDGKNVASAIELNHGLYEEGLQPTRNHHNTKSSTSSLRSLIYSIPKLPAHPMSRWLEEVPLDGPWSRITRLQADAERRQYALGAVLTRLLIS